MKDLNDVTLLGNLGTDPEVKAFDNGGQIMRLKVATNRHYKDGNGEWVKLTEWHLVVVKVPQMVERLARQLRKGSRVLVKGSIETRKYTVQEQVRYSTEIIVAGAGMFVADETPKDVALTSTPQEERPPASQPARPAADFDDEIPF